MSLLNTSSPRMKSLIEKGLITDPASVDDYLHNLRVQANYSLPNLVDPAPPLDQVLRPIQVDAKRKYNMGLMHAEQPALGPLMYNAARDFTSRSIIEPFMNKVKGDKKVLNELLNIPISEAVYGDRVYNKQPEGPDPLTNLIYGER